MSNHNAFWGLRFGSVQKDGTNGFRIKRPSLSGSGNAGKAQNTAETAQAKRDKAAYQQMLKDTGRPVIYDRAR